MRTCRANFGKNLLVSTSELFKSRDGLLLKNGELLRTASLEFDVLLTADRNMQYQQNIPKFDIGLAVLALRDSRLPSIQTKLSEIEAAVAAVEPGAVIRITD